MNVETCVGFTTMTELRNGLEITLPIAHRPGEVIVYRSGWGKRTTLSMPQEGDPHFDPTTPESVVVTKRAKKEGEWSETVVDRINLQNNNNPIKVDVGRRRVVIRAKPL